jgi:hypothetical protein
MPAAATSGVFAWDREAVRFRDASTGRFVPQSRVREAIDAFADGVADELESLTRRYLAGSLDIAEWEESARSTIKAAHMATAAIAAGGRDRMGPIQAGRAGSRIRREYEYLFNLSRSVERGDVSDAQLLARIRLFGLGSTRAYEAARRGEMINAGFSEEARFTHATNSCGPCLDYASRGWVPIGTLPSTGTECDCVSNCKCTFSYRGKRSAPADSESAPEPPPALAAQSRPPAPSKLPPKDAPLASPDDPAVLFTASDRSRQSSDKVVWVDASTLDAAWAADDPAGSVETGGTGPSSRPGAYAAFGDFLARSRATGRQVEMSRVYMDRAGKIDFLDGRHRFAFERDRGFRLVPVAVPKEAARRFARRYGVSGP